MIIGIIGNGFVGKATKILKNRNVDIICFDINPELCEPHGLVLTDLLKCDIIFVSVPTPMNKDGTVYLDIVKSVINDLNSIHYEGFIVIRSTVLPGTSDNLNVYFMPEFLTEKNYINDFKTNPLWVFGLLNNDRDKLFKKKISELLTSAYKENCIESNKIEWMLNKEAEMVKYFRNTFLSVKVSYCNEIYEYCKIKNIDYDTVRNIAAQDKRIGLSHTQVPGHDGNFGFGGTCFPKDTTGLLKDMVANNMKSYILEASIERNEKKDRPNKDWKDKKGRAII
tara:strand:- start:221 stop:1063 length:843 start_codon:yes stop_codon:yes gene_type:complete